MENYKKFSRFDPDFIHDEYHSFSPERKLSLWWNLIVQPMIFGSSTGDDNLVIFTPENFQKWKAVENDIEFYLSMLISDIIEHGYQPVSMTEADLKNEMFRRMDTKYINKIHSTIVDGYDGSLKELASDIGDLQYDALADFLMHLSVKINHDSQKDALRKRHKLANKLSLSVEGLGMAESQIRDAWNICKKYMS